MVERVRGAKPPARTMLEQLIRERQQTFEEFAEYAGVFAHDHGESGTLSVRHLQRLVAGRQPDGTPLGPLRPATARLLERIFDAPISNLLAAPAADQPVSRFERGVLDRSNQYRHLLCVVVAVVLKEPDVLVVCRREGEGTGISWQFPAGMVKPNMPPTLVAVRETLKETGVHCKVARELGSRVHPITNVLCHYLLCDYMAGEAENLDPAENASVMWISKNRLTHLIPASNIFPPVLEYLAPEGHHQGAGCASNTSS